MKTKKRLPVLKIGARRTENIQGWKEMPLYGQFVRQNKDQRNNETWTWLKVGKLKRETESLIIAAQDQAITTNSTKAMTDRSQADHKCEMCKQNNETISHIESTCPKLTQKESKKRRDNVARAIHWDLSGKYGFQRNERWYDHVLDKISREKFERSGA